MYSRKIYIPWLYQITFKLGPMLFGLNYIAPIVYQIIKVYLLTTIWLGCSALKIFKVYSYAAIRDFFFKKTYIDTFFLGGNDTGSINTLNLPSSSSSMSGCLRW